MDITAKTLDANTYPPRVKITVYMKDNVDVVRVQIKVKGSASDEQLHTDLSFPFKGIATLLVGMQGFCLIPSPFICMRKKHCWYPLKQE